MIQKPPTRVEFLQGTLDLVILQTLLAGPTHRHAIAKHIQRTAQDLLQVETGSLYPALYRLEAKGWIAASWELSDKGKRAKYYRLRPLGRKQLVTEQSKWTAFARAMRLILESRRENALVLSQAWVVMEAARQRS
jgi:PadR family transcriptional regulator PadR